MKVAQSYPTLCNSMDYTVHGILQARIVEWVAVRFSRGSSQPGDWTQVSWIAGKFFTIWATREPKNIRLGNLSLLQEIFPTQESNWGLLHCRQIRYQLRYQGSPRLGKQDPFFNQGAFTQSSGVPATSPEPDSVHDSLRGESCPCCCHLEN